MTNVAPMPPDCLESVSDLPLEDRPIQLDRHGPIFILGCPRSGTTFLAQSLARAHAIEEVTGILAPPRVMHLLGRMTRDGEDTRPLTRCIRDVFWQVLWRRRCEWSERVASVLRGRSSPTSLLSRPSLAGVLFAYKEPFLCFGIEALMAEFPGCRVLHIIRDGRDNADSLDRTYPDALSDGVLQDPVRADNKNSEIGTWRDHDGWCVPWWVPEGRERAFVSATKFGRCLWLWREMTERGQAAGARLGPGRYLEIRYEDLVQSPAEYGRKVAEFLDRPMTYRYRRYLNKAHTNSVEIHRRRTNAAKSREAELIAGETLRRLGYA
jgi:hypothetical protein